MFKVLCHVDGTDEIFNLSAAVRGHTKKEVLFDVMAIYGTCTELTWDELLEYVTGCVCYCDVSDLSDEEIVDIVAKHDGCEIAIPEERFVVLEDLWPDLYKELMEWTGDG